MERKAKLLLEKQGYRIVGEHSSVKICEWTRKSLTDKDICYKEKFYGIKSHQCCQMTPWMNCCNKCIFCWRDTSTENEIKGISNPKEIIKGCVEAQKGLLSGFGGNKEVNRKKLEEAQNPQYFAISLTGEPTLYPKINELIKELKKQGKCTFLVTNGMFPEIIEKMEMPTQLYISVDAPNEKLFKEIDRSNLRDGWGRLNKTLEIMKDLKTRKVIRITLIKGMNMTDEKGYAKLIEKAKPDFIELKAYMWVGHSRERMEISNMPIHEEIKEFSEKISKETGYEIIDEKESSRVVLLGDNRKRFIWK